MPNKALKSGANATPRSALQLPTREPRSEERTVEAYREAMACGAAAGRAEMSAHDAGQRAVGEVAREGGGSRWPARLHRRDGERRLHSRARRGQG